MLNFSASMAVQQRMLCAGDRANFESSGCTALPHFELAGKTLGQGNTVILHCH